MKKTIIYDKIEIESFVKFEVISMLNEKIEFYGKTMSIKAISMEIGISRDTLQKYYEETHNIYEAEKICRDVIMQKSESLVDYNGEMLTIQTIAKKEGLKDAKTLKKYYE